MKAILVIIFCVHIQMVAYAQTLSDTLRISDTKISHLVCPGKVDYVQAGDYSLVQAEIVPELANMVRIKAARAFEKPTSLTVVCQDLIYTFELRYGNGVPTTYPVECFHGQDARTCSGKLMPDYVLRELSEQILSSHHHRRCYRRRKREKDGIRVRLNSIYLKDDALFFEMELKNETQLAFDVESIYFWITDKRKAKATNVQEYRVSPDYQHHKVTQIPGETSVREVFVFEKITIPDGRVLRFELNEKALGNTGRKLSVELKNKDILKTRKL